MKILKIIGAVIAIILITILSLNLFDDTLDPNIEKVIMVEPNTVTEAEVENYYRYLGFQAAAEADPVKEGEEYAKAIVAKSKSRDIGFVQKPRELKEVYMKVRCLTYQCNLEEFAEEKEEVEKGLNDNAILIERYREIVKGGVLKSPLPISYEALTAGSVIRLFSVAKMSRIDMRLKIHNGQLQAAKEQILGEYNFHRATLLGSSKSLLETLIHLNVLKSLRRFTLNMFEFYPKFKKASTELGPVLQPANLDFDSLVANIFQTEVSSIASVFLQKDLSFTDMMILDRGNFKKKWWVKIVDPILSLFYKPNKSLNLYYTKYNEIMAQPCVKDKVKRCGRGIEKMSWMDYLVNPAGKKLVSLWTMQINKRFDKMYVNVAELNEVAKKRSR